MVFWLIGISGAGKTTLGRKLEKHFHAIEKKCYLLDGDEIRDLFDHDLGYTEADREANIKRIILGAYIMDKNDIIGIICNIGPFEHLRQLARKKIEGYNEIYLRKDLKASIKNDVKGMYKENIGKTHIVGLDSGFDEPVSPDLVLYVDDETETESYEKILNYIKEKYGEQYS